MSYIGSTPTTQSFVAGTDYFNGTGSQVAFTLSRSVNSVNDIEVIVNNVEQIPSGYSVSGTTLTFSAAPSAGTSNVYVRYLSTTLLSVVAGNVTPTAVSDQLNSSTGYFDLPAGTTAQRPSTPVAGMTRYNTTTGQPEWYDAVNAVWKAFSTAPAYELTYLVVAGGGGGAGETGGGGGAGGFRTATGFSLSLATNYVVTVGAGGAGGVGFGEGSTGSSSVFSTITSLGGGFGASNSVNGGAGGSGGGGGHSPAIGGLGTEGQGNAGGAGANAGISEYGGGGGGGASAVGAQGQATGTGNGGAGTASSITGTSVTYAGGGGGGNYGTSATPGQGGAGGGGNGGNSVTNPTAGTANTGGGGGGQGNNKSNGAAGGSGVVILRYPPSLTISNSGGGLTFSTATDGSNKVTTFTAGTGNIQFA